MRPSGDDLAGDLMGDVACFVGEIFLDGDTFVGDGLVGEIFVGDVRSPDAASAPFSESLSILIIDAIFSSTAFMPGV